MANPQKENGSFMIANELAEAFALLQLNSSESRLLWFILRKTYGWNKKTDRISHSQFSSGTGIERRNVGRALNSLIKRGIIIKSGTGRQISYGLHKNYNSWDSSSELKAKPIVVVSEGTLSSELKAKSSSIQKDTNNNKDNLQNTAVKSGIWIDLLNTSLFFLQQQKEAGLNHQHFKKVLTTNSTIVTSGAKTLEKLIQIDGEKMKDIKNVLRYILNDTGNENWSGWKHQIISLASLRNKSRNGLLKYFNAKNSMQNQSHASGPPNSKKLQEWKITE